MKLYKYRNNETARIILKTQTLRAANLNLLNDPFDLNIESLMGADYKEDFSTRAEALWDVFIETDVAIELKDSTSEKAKYIQDVLKKSTPEQRDIYKQRLIESLKTEHASEDTASHEKALSNFRLEVSKDGIICFSDTPDINPCWAHYANNHSGVALCFEANGAKDSLLTRVRSVHYSDERPVIHKTNKQFVINSFFRKQEDVLRNYFEDLIYTKSSSWSYEKEVRVSLPRFIDPSIGYKDFLFHPEELTSIYFGNRCNQEELFQIVELGLKLNPNMNFFKMVTNKYSFRLDAIPLDI